ncbi:MAG TPA: PilZ domain-containing protein [Nitrospira sp.]|nr:PilZ domain-containing protein [Nitrospira sp.]
MRVRVRATRDDRRLEKRKQPRFTAQFRSTFSGGQREGQGKTVDLSDGGCRIETEQPVVTGASFECRIYVPGLNWPLRIDEAKVRWVRERSFGLEFTSIKPAEQIKLRQVIAQLKIEQSA